MFSTFIRFPMFERESILPLLVAMMLAVAAHLGAAVGFVAVQQGGTAAAGEAIRMPLKSLPDLVVSAITVSEPRIAGKPSVITARIANLGQPLEQPVSVVCTVDGREIARKSVPTYPGQPAFDYTADAPGVHEVKIIVDADAKITEADEENNQRQLPFIWLDESQSDPAKKKPIAELKPDLTVVGIDVSKPRIAGDPSTLNLAVGNLGGAVLQPVTIQILLDGAPLQQLRLDPPLAPGSLTPLTVRITVDKPGEHEIQVTADPANAIYESRENNNSKSARFTWVTPDDAIKIGQEKPSPVEINWISYDDFQQLQARKAKFDQAALQRSAKPDPNAMTIPLDPTDPGARRPAADAQPIPPSEKPTPQTTAAQAMAQPSPQLSKPAQPVQPVNPTPVTPAPPQSAPSLTQSNTKLAAAPRQDAAKPESPSRSQPGTANGSKSIAKSDSKSPPTKSDSPQSATPVKTESKAASDSRSTTSRDLALNLPPVSKIPSTGPTMPAPPPPAKSSEPLPAAAVKSETKNSKLDNSSPTLAALPITPKLDAPAGAPAAKQKPAESAPPVDRKNMMNEKPVEPAAKPAEGQQSKPSDQPTQAPTPVRINKPMAQPSTPSEARPTLAPRDPARESPPVSRIENLTIRPGQVLAAQGLQINTIAPRFTPVAQYSSAPSNPDVLVVFNKQGQVIKAEIPKTSGYKNIDGPLLASLYKWSAQGDLLKKVPETLTLQVHIILSSED